jgi:hypothetical protein
MPGKAGGGSAVAPGWEGPLDDGETIGASSAAGATGSGTMNNLLQIGHWHWLPACSGSLSRIVLQ